MGAFWYWLNLMSKSKAFIWAKLWGSMAVASMLLFCWAFANSQWEWVMLSVVPFCFSVGSALEALSEAYKYAFAADHLRQKLYADRTTLARPGEPQLAEVDPATSEEASPELTDASKLELCQFYVFLFMLFERHQTGENNLHRLLAIPVRRYREWLNAIAAPGLELVELAPNARPRLASKTFEQVLAITAAYNQQAWMWDFAKKVYADRRNWFEYNPKTQEAGPGRYVAINTPHYQGPPTTLLPIYPHNLDNLHIEFNG
jgi:hypothetical protein